MNRMLVCTLLTYFLVFTSQVKALDSNENYRKLLDTYYFQGKESHVYQDIVKIAQAVVNNRKNYNSDMVAKAFSLLSDIAFNRGDVVAALQFAQYGSDVATIDVLIKLDLLLKVARGYYSQGKYIQLRDISQETAWLAEQAGNMNYHLQASAYSAVAYALSADHTLAVAELSTVEHLLSQNKHRVEQVAVLEIIAEAHFYLAEYGNAVQLLNRVLKLRVEMSKVKGIARTYHLLAAAYYQLHQYDDAYHAYWQSKQLSSKYGLNIRSSYAELGLGQVLHQQQKFPQAKAHLAKALVIFEEYNLPRAKLSAEIALVKVNYALGDSDEAVQSLLVAESLAENQVLTPQQIELYLMLSEYYRTTSQFQQAVKVQQRYIELYRGFNPETHGRAVIAENTSNKSKDLALNLADQSELSLQFNEKYHRQQVLILLLTVTLVCIALIAILGRVRRYRKKRHQGYDEIDLPKNQLSRPAKTKYWYQQQYKIARKYQYKVSIAYLVVENWQELDFHFSKKVLADVYQAIAIIVNENLDEEDFSGEISVGEYLFLCPYQDTEQMDVKLTRIKQAIKTRFFANLGDYSVKISFLVDSPNIQDIDPYVFLSRLSDRTDAEYNE